MKYQRFAEGLSIASEMLIWSLYILTLSTSCAFVFKLIF